MPAEAELFLFRLDAKEIGRPIEKVAIETGRCGERIYECGALFFGWVIEKCAGFFFGRDAPDDAEIGAAEEGGIVNAGVGFQAGFLGRLRGGNRFFALLLAPAWPLEAWRRRWMRARQRGRRRKIG